MEETDFWYMLLDHSGYIAMVLCTLFITVMICDMWDTHCKQRHPPPPPLPKAPSKPDTTGLSPEQAQELWSRYYETFLPVRKEN